MATNRKRPHPAKARSNRPAATRRPARSQAPTSRRQRRHIYRPAFRVPTASPLGRLRVGMLAVALLFTVCGARLAQLQAFDTPAYAQAADAQVHRAVTLPAARGAILDRNGVPLATSEPAVNITCDPTLVGYRSKTDTAAERQARAQETADVIAEHLGGEAEDYLAALTTPGVRFAYVRRDVPAADFADLAAELNERGLAGIFPEKTALRHYPNHKNAANVVGFVNQEGAGQAGLEAWLDPQLAGTPGEEVYEQTAYGRVPLGSTTLTPARNGHTVVTTIDADLQAFVQGDLKRAVAQAGGNARGWVVAMNVTNGEVLALAQTPTYDPADYATATPAALGNLAGSEAFEPGSVAKLLTFAAAYDAGVITPDTKMVVPASITSGDHKIKDFVEHGTIRLTARGVLAQSSNIGTTMIARELGKEKLLSYLQGFGLGERTGVQIPGEASGFLNPEMTDMGFDRAAFGQAYSVTAIQMATSIAAIANGGVYQPPTLIKSVTDADGREVYVDDRKPHRVVSETAAKQVLDGMEAVVNVHYDELFAVDGYRVGGKTGTAEQFVPECNCYGSSLVSFVSVGDVEDPSILIYLAIDRPAGEPSGAKQAAPAATDMMRFALGRYGVPYATEPRQHGKTTW